MKKLYKILLLTSTLLFSTPSLANWDGPRWRYGFGWGPFIDPYPCSYPDCPGNPYVEEYLYNREKWERKQWRERERDWQEREREND